MTMTMATIQIGVLLPKYVGVRFVRPFALDRLVIAVCGSASITLSEW